jgi:drug/metabolite transporter superfamily protein YnfA
MIEIDAGETVWRFDRAFLTSNWTCIWGRGCQGILPQPAEQLGHGCCSLGADLGDLDESLNLSANAATLRAEQFEHHAEAATGGIYSDASRLHTRVVDGACIFLNRPDFAGGAGCALHVAARAWGESPIEWKPSVCWQLPVHVDWTERDEHTEVATVRGWTRGDWGDDGEKMAWCCTEEAAAYVGDHPVVESLGEELTALVGEAVYVELRRRLHVD